MIREDEIQVTKTLKSWASAFVQNQSKTNKTLDHQTTCLLVARVQAKEKGETNQRTLIKLLLRKALNKYMLWVDMTL